MNNLVNKRLLIILLSSLMVFAIVFGGIYTVNRQKNENKASSESESEAPAPLTEDYITVLLAGVDESEMLTDVIMIGRYDIKNNKVNLIQVPRDCYIGDDYKTGKINSVYGRPREGEKKIDTLKRELETRMKITIDYYGIVTLEGLRLLVDDLGGVEIEIPDYFENLVGSLLKPGKQTINGKEAEWLIRYRAGYKTADIGRMNTQELFMRAMFSTIKSKSTYDLSKVMMNNFSHFDTNVPLSKAMSVANQGVKLTNDDITAFIVPGNGKMNFSYAVYEVDEEALAEILNEHFLLPDENVTADDLDFPRVPPQPIPVEPPVSSEDSSENLEDQENLENPESSSEGESDMEEASSQEPLEENQSVPEN